MVGKERHTGENKDDEYEDGVPVTDRPRLSLASQRKIGGGHVNPR